jgi:hypothetical protein
MEGRREQGKEDRVEGRRNMDGGPRGRGTKVRGRVKRGRAFGRRWEGAHREFVCGGTNDHGRREGSAGNTTGATEGAVEDHEGNGSGGRRVVKSAVGTRGGKTLNRVEV